MIKKNNKKIYAENVTTIAPDCKTLQSQYCDLLKQSKKLIKECQEAVNDLENFRTDFTNTKNEYDAARKKWFDKKSNNKEKNDYNNENEDGSAETDLFYIENVRKQITKLRKDKPEGFQKTIDDLHSKNEKIFGTYHKETNPLGCIKLLRDLKNMETSLQKAEFDLTKQINKLKNDYREVQGNITDKKSAINETKGCSIPTCP